MAYMRTEHKFTYIVQLLLLFGLVLDSALAGETYKLGDLHGAAFDSIMVLLMLFGFHLQWELRQ